MHVCIHTPTPTHIHTPPHTILQPTLLDSCHTYRPSFLERLKWAWVQYLAITLVFWYLLRHVQSFVFENHIIPTIKDHSD